MLREAGWAVREALPLPPAGLCSLAVWDPPGSRAADLLLVDDSPVLHVPGEVGQPQQAQDLPRPR